MRLIPIANIDNFSKCPVFVEAKYAQKPLKSVTSRKIQLLNQCVQTYQSSKTQSAKEERNTTPPGGLKGII